MKKSLYYCLLICLSAMMALPSCSNENDDSNVKNEEPAQYMIKLSAPQMKVLSQSNDFAFDVLKAVNNENSNAFISPYSLGQALAMIANGAEGETLEEIAAVLKIGDGISIDDINSYYATMNKALTDIKCSSQIAFANSLWVNKDFDGTILDSYKKNMQSSYDAMVDVLDFADSKSTDIINSWSKKQTNGLIPTIVDNLSNDMPHTILLNSLYFKGLWSYFPKTNTYSDNFRNQFDRNEKVKMMKSDKCELAGFVTDEELMAEFDYGGKAFQMQIIMPKKEKINDYIQDLDGEKYAEMLSYLTKSKSIVAMPKFKSKYSYNLENPLKAMGITKAFSDYAEFGKISTKKEFKITKALQNTTIEVNEEGSVASATTRIDGSVDTNVGELPKEFIIDHPFIYLIRERQTGVILFIGKVQSMEGMQN